MTDVKRLLKEATQEHQGCACSGLYGHLRGRGIVVQVVNSLPAYEAAVSALAYYVNERDAYHDCANDAPNWRHRCRVAKARKALRRLREEAS